MSAAAAAAGDTDDEARLNYHCRLLVVATPVIRTVITEGSSTNKLVAGQATCGRW